MKTNKYNNNISVIEFYSDWCGSCNDFSKKIGKIYKSYLNRAIFYRVNIDKDKQCATKFGIKELPTIIIFKDSTEITRIIGAITLKKLKYCTAYVNPIVPAYQHLWDDVLYSSDV